ncbi:josephin-2 [Striga asiatica]|uniref:Josephin-2 n=1 Tax=Striga asiatica TaxID=4170 RepID=A0A5A7P0S3_STRAF|nr:josephin-2 [Striga asiatica]
MVQNHIKSKFLTSKFPPPYGDPQYSVQQNNSTPHSLCRIGVKLSTYFAALGWQRNRKKTESKTTRRLPITTVLPASPTTLNILTLPVRKKQWRERENVR